MFYTQTLKDGTEKDSAVIAGLEARGQAAQGQPRAAGSPLPGGSPAHPGGGARGHDWGQEEGDPPAAVEGGPDRLCLGLLEVGALPGAL